MITSDVMDELAAAVRTVGSLQGRTYAYPVEQLTPPAAIIPYPDVDYDLTMARGADGMEFSVVVLTSPVSDRAGRDRLLAYIDGAGAESVKAAVEQYAYTAFHSVRVQSCTVEQYFIGDIAYWAAIFALDLIGSGT